MTKSKIPYWKKYYAKNKEKIQARRKLNKERKKEEHRWFVEDDFQPVYRDNFEKMQKFSSEKMEKFSIFIYICFGLVLSLFILLFILFFITNNLYLKHIIIIFQLMYLGLQIIALIFNIFEYKEKIKRRTNQIQKQSTYKETSEKINPLFRTPFKISGSNRQVRQTPVYCDKEKK